MNKLILSLVVQVFFHSLSAQNRLDSILPVRGFCIGAPSAEDMETFLKFVDEELAPRNVNTLIIRIDYNYQFESHPELVDSGALSKKDVKKLVAICRKNRIQLIPQINMLGHQSWAGKTNNLLRVYPQFDETPHIKMPLNYKWPNSEGLYCKSYCPLHPEVHKVVYGLMDEICDVFESDAFHAGMDEVFYIGHDSCIRCSGMDKAILFAGEVNSIRNHLAQNNRKLWIWGDRLIDGKTTGIGMWEASMNNTYHAVNMISKDVVICDWHYERPDPTAVYFAMKGLGVITCPWRNPDVALIQTRAMVQYRKSVTTEMKDRFQGMMQTVWYGADSFLKDYYSEESENRNTEVCCFKAMFGEINNM